MKKYRVTGNITVFGVGMVLKLSSSQANIRASSLKGKSKDSYLVVEPVQFKQGEEIVVISGNVSKSLLNNLSDLSEDGKSIDNKKSKDDGKDQKSANNKKSSAKDQNNKSVKKDNKKVADKSKQAIDLPENSDEAVVDNDDINNLPNL